MNPEQELTAARLDLTAQGGITAIVTRFADSQDRKSSTRVLYSRNVAAFLRWVIMTGRMLPALSAADIIQYKEDLLRRGMSTLTVAGYINAVRRFFSWTASTGIYPNIATEVQAPKRIRDYRKRPLSLEQANALIKYTDQLGLRDRAIVNLMLRTGLRCIEVTRANVGDIRYIGEDNTRVLFVQGKGRDEKDNFVVLTDATYSVISDYLATRGHTAGSDPLFLSVSAHRAKAEKHQHETDYNPARLSTRTVSYIAKEALKAIGLDDAAFTAHSLRHTAATAILRAGGTLEQAQMALRHSNPATTEIYAQMALKERRLSEGGEKLLDRVFTAGERSKRK